MQGLKGLFGAEVRAQGLRMGIVDDLLIDESTWTIRWAIVRGNTRLAAPADRLRVLDATSRSLELSSESAAREDSIGGLKSAREILVCRARALNGPCGMCVDLLVDTETWTVLYLVVNTKERIAQRQVLVPLTWVRSICSEQSRIEIASGLSGRAPRFMPDSHDVAQGGSNGSSGRRRFKGNLGRPPALSELPSGAALILR